MLNACGTQSWFVHINVCEIRHWLCTLITQQVQIPGKKSHVLLVLTTTTKSRENGNVNGKSIKDSSPPSWVLSFITITVTQEHVEDVQQERVLATAGVFTGVSIQTQGVSAQRLMSTHTPAVVFVYLAYETGLTFNIVSQF